MPGEDQVFSLLATTLIDRERGEEASEVLAPGTEPETVLMRVELSISVTASERLGILQAMERPDDTRVVGVRRRLIRRPHRTGARRRSRRDRGQSPVQMCLDLLTFWTAWPLGVLERVAEVCGPMMVPQNRGQLPARPSRAVRAERYAHAPELAQYGPYASKHLDYLGHRYAAEKLAERLCGKLLIPSGDDATPESTVVVAEIAARRSGSTFSNGLKASRQWR